MSYSIRRWLTCSDGAMFDDSAKAKIANEAIKQAERLQGILNILNDDDRARIRELEPGKTVFIKKPSLKFTMNIRRNKR